MRSPDEFSGKLLAPAHLPAGAVPARRPHPDSAVNVPWSKAANDDGTFKSPDDLRALYDRRGVCDSSRSTIAYCRIGERSVPHLVRAPRAAGSTTDVKNYDGSWTEYGSLIGVPVELGDGKS